MRCRCRTYQFFFTDGYSLANLSVTLWTTARHDGAPARRLPAASRSICVSPPAGSPAYVQGLAIFPLFVPSIILSYAFIRVLGPNGMVDILLNAVHLPKIRSPYLTPWGPVIGLVWDNIPLTVLILLSGLGSVSNAVGRGRPRRRRRTARASSGTSSCRASANSILVGDLLHGARHLLGLHAALRARPGRAGDDGTVHAAHLPRHQRSRPTPSPRRSSPSSSASSSGSSTSAPCAPQSEGGR